MFSLIPTKSRLRNRLGRGWDVRDASVRSWEIAPPRRRHSPAALYLPQDLDRVTGFHEDSSQQLEDERLRVGQKEHAATTAHLLRDAYLLDGHLYTASGYLRLTVSKPRWIASRPRMERHHGVLAGSQYGARYFGHWLLDDVPLAVAAAALGDPVVPWRADTRHQQDYLAHLDVRQEIVPAAHFREIVVLDDVGQNDHRKARYEGLRRAIRSARSETPHAGVLLLRKATGVSRRFANEDEVEKALRDIGFRALCPEEHTVGEVIDACLGARVVVGLEGSQLAHGLLTIVDEGTLLVLQPPDRFNNVFKDYCDCLGLRYGFVVGNRTGTTEGFRIDTRSLLTLIDRL